MQASVILCIENRVLCVFFSLISTQQLCQLCYHSLGKSHGWHTNTPRLRKSLWNPASERNLRPLQPHGSISAMRQLLVSMLLVRRGCHQHLRRVHKKSRKHYRALQRTLLRRGKSTNGSGYLWKQQTENMQLNKCRPSLSHCLPHGTPSALMCGYMSAKNVSLPKRSRITERMSSSLI